MSVRADRDTYRLALDCAIEWQLSLLAIHNPAPGAMQACCTPRNRCQEYRDDLALLRRFRAAHSALRPATGTGRRP